MANQLFDQGFGQESDLEDVFFMESDFLTKLNELEKKNCAKPKNS